MQKPSFDPGLTQKYAGNLRRVINPDGQFNVVRRGANWRDFHPYLGLVSMSWVQYFLTMLGGYMALNVVFAVLYFLLGPGTLEGGFQLTPFDRFLTGFYFSSQTLTTVGFGALAPKSHGGNIAAAMEAFCGVLSFSVATGLLFGRVSKPSARIGFSEHALMAPYQDAHAFQFRIVNRRTNSLMQLEATVMLMTLKDVGDATQRDFQVLQLERDSVLFFPLTWTIVHPVDASSPLSGKTAEDLRRVQAEFLILIKGWDETFGQTVHQRFSYRFDEIVWESRFAPTFSVDTNGEMVLEVDKVGAYVSAQG